MAGSYDHSAIEKKWQKIWDETNLSEIDPAKDSNKFYCLDMFPYPSGDGLHVGHWRGYVLSDYFARFYRLQGKTVLHPIGFDAFGLPAENAAIKAKSHPQQFITQAIQKFTAQLKQIGAAYDWSKTINTSDPDYYKWTQWLFLQLFKHGYAEKRLSWVNWCPKDQTVLANEQVIGGQCERCGSRVTKKQLSQWYLKITNLAEELLDGLETLDWPENVKALQRNWIGKSVGTTVMFHTEKITLEVFTTRPETLYGVNAIILAPEHPEVLNLTMVEYQDSILQYLEQAREKTDLDRQKEIDTTRTGVFTGSYALHPLNRQQLPIWVADYVLPNYGSGAIMAVPAHDQRDFEFTKAHNLPILPVIAVNEDLPFTGEGKIKNSDIYDGLNSVEAGQKITADLARRGLGHQTINYRLRDWLVSRQRYWGAPIPIVYDPAGNIHPVKEEHLPILLPEDVDFQPGGENPIKSSAEFKQRAVDLYGQNWQLETDTLDTFVDSSWYFLRFLSPTDSTQAFDPDLVAKWLPVDLYIGGIEHAILHLLYARFIYRFLVKHQYIKTDHVEPFQRLFNIGMITLHGAKMSKSKNNVVSPDPLVEHYGTDALRGYELFLGPMENSLDWNPRGINGIHRFLIKIWQRTAGVTNEKNKSQEGLFDQYLTNISAMIKDFRLNTVLSEAMIFVNKLGHNAPSIEVWRRFLLTIGPAFPFLTEELWQKLGHQETIFQSRWPEPFGQTTTANAIKVLINQKFIGELSADEKITEAKVIAQIRQTPELTQKLQGQTIIRTIYKPGELINLVTK